MDARLYATIGQVLHERIPLQHANHVQVIHVLRCRQRCRQLNLGPRRQRRGIGGGVRGPLCVPPSEVRQLRAQDRGLKSVEPRIEALHHMVILPLLPEVAQKAQALGQIGSSGDHHPAVAGCPEVLGRVEAEASRVAQCPAAAPEDTGAVSLTGVLDDGELRLRRDRQHGIDVAWLPVEMHRDDRLCARRDRAFDLSRIEAEGALLDVHEHGPGAAGRHRQRGGDVRVRRNNHFIVLTNAEGDEREPQGIEAGADAHGVRASDARCELLLELRHLLAENEARAIHDPGKRRLQFEGQLLMLAAKVDEGNRQRGGHGLSCPAIGAGRWPAGRAARAFPTTR